VKKTVGLRQAAQDAARDAAPYVHPKLSAVDMRGKLDGDLSVTFKTVYEAPPEKK